MAADLSLLTTSALGLRDQMASGALKAIDLTEACIARIEAREPDVQAWAWFDAEAARGQARRLDERQASGKPLGPLHGLPVGVKDIIDTAGIPTRNGCALDEDRVPTQDAVVVQHLKAAGAIVFGKTVTTELAYLQPNVTRNPRNFGHTPGGSSSGSAAAVADRMVPLAIGTQTGGSVVRPASFCGIMGFKPSFGAISKEGVLVQSPSLDTVGVFARDPGSASLLASVLMDGVEAQRSAPGAPVFGWVSLPEWQRADQAVHEGFRQLRRQLGDQVMELTLPALFDDVVALRADLNHAEMGQHLASYLQRGADRLGPMTRVAIEDGQQISADRVQMALDRQIELGPSLEPLFAQCDVLLCPAALGPAPKGLGSTGDSVFNGLWTMAGTPAITLPLLEDPSGLPMGVQLVGAIGQDAELLQVAGWLWDWAASNGYRAADG